MPANKDERTHRTQVADGLAVRSPREIAERFFELSGQRISVARVYQHLERAHEKIAAALGHRYVGKHRSGRKRRGSMPKDPLSVQ